MGGMCGGALYFSDRTPTRTAVLQSLDDVSHSLQSLGQRVLPTVANAEGLGDTQQLLLIAGV